MPQPYIGRLAPSPTGLLHLGHAATFWIAYQRAQSKGTLLLRIEDLDTQRSKPHFTEAILEDLTWLGISWHPPVLYQSQRLLLYREALDQLLITGQIYPCHCSRKDLVAMMHAPHEDTDDEPVYPGICRPPRNAHQYEALFQPTSTTASVSPTAKPSSSWTKTSALNPLPPAKISATSSSGAKPLTMIRTPAYPATN